MGWKIKEIYFLRNLVRGGAGRCSELQSSCSLWHSGGFVLTKQQGSGTILCPIYTHLSPAFRAPCPQEVSTLFSTTRRCQGTNRVLIFGSLCSSWRRAAAQRDFITAHSGLQVQGDRDFNTISFHFLTCIFCSTCHHRESGRKAGSVLKMKLGNSCDLQNC